MTVPVYVDTGKQAGLRSSQYLRECRRRENLVRESGPEGVAFEYDGLEMKEAANQGGLLQWTLAAGMEKSAKRVCP